MNIYVLSAFSILWLLIIFIINLTLTGKIQVWLCSALRIFMLLSVLIIITLIQIGTLFVDETTFSSLVLLCAILAVGHFFASDFTKYVKAGTPAAAKAAIMTASITLLVLTFIIFLIIRRP